MGGAKHDLYADNNHTQALHVTLGYVNLTFPRGIAILDDSII